MSRQERVGRADRQPINRGRSRLASQRHQRRLFIKDLFAFAATVGLLNPTLVWSAQGDLSGWNKAAFEAQSLGEVLKALGRAPGGPAVAESKSVFLTVPDIAEDGASVPVEVNSQLPQTEAIYVLVEKNPNWLAAAFNFSANALPSVATRIKMNQSSKVVALVKAHGKFFMSQKEVKVTLGGCGA